MLAKYEQFFILLGRKIDLLHTFSPKLCVVGFFFLQDSITKNIPEGVYRRICTVAVL